MLPSSKEPILGCIHEFQMILIGKETNQPQDGVEGLNCELSVFFYIQRTFLSSSASSSFATSIETFPN